MLLIGISEEELGNCVHTCIKSQFQTDATHWSQYSKVVLVHYSTNTTCHDTILEGSSIFFVFIEFISVISTYAWRNQITYQSDKRVGEGSWERENLKMKWSNACDYGKHYSCTKSACPLCRLATYWNKGHLHLFLQQRTFVYILPAQLNWWNSVIWKAHGQLSSPRNGSNQLLE